MIGQGTWALEEAPRAEAIRALHAGMDLGMTLIDTAEMYGSGAVEEIVGEALAGRRDDAFLVTKVLPGNAYRRGTVEACERSLRRLRTAQIDLYLLHWPGPHPVEDTVAAFEELQQKGHIRYWGLSNFDTEALDHIRAEAGPRGITPRQAALAFLVRHPSVIAIPKAASPAHVAENAAAGEVTLDPTDIARLEAAFPLGDRPTSLPTL